MRRTVIAASTARKLRNGYKAAWTRDWPFDNAYLSELWQDAREALMTKVRGRRAGEVFNLALVLMRETHPF